MDPTLLTVHLFPAPGSNRSFWDLQSAKMGQLSKRGDERMRGRPRRDISNKRFGRLVAVRSRSRPLRWLCKCDCGKMKIVPLPYLISGHTKSCGCLSFELYGETHKHGHRRNRKPSPTYKTYQNMIGRCEYPTFGNYPRYGGRGITVCPRWREDFSNFLIDMGERPNIKTDIHRKNRDRKSVV